MKIEHVAAYVNDLEKARDFFVEFLNGTSNGGYHNQNTGFRSYFISFEDGARLELMNKPGMAEEGKSPDRTGYAHLAFSVGSKERVDELTDQLKDILRKERIRFILQSGVESSEVSAQPSTATMPLAGEANCT